MSVTERIDHDLPAKFPNTHSEIPWEAIYYMRNRIIHSYASVDYERVWQVVTRDLPLLQVQLNSLQVPDS